MKVKNKNAKIFDFRFSVFSGRFASLLKNENTDGYTEPRTALSKAVFHRSIKKLKTR